MYLRARYLAPGLGTFASRDPWRGTDSAPRTWNGYAWVEGNVFNRVDPGGMCAQLTNFQQSTSCDCAHLKPNFQEHLDCLSRCGRTPKQLPAANTSNCPLRELNAVNVLAQTADTETDGRGLLSQDNRAIAALMIFQLNNYRVGGGWFQLGTWERSNLDPLQFENSGTLQMRQIAELMVEGYCSSDDPLALLTGPGYTDIEMDADLQAIARDQRALFEVSIDASRVDQFRNDTDYPLQYVASAPGASRAVVIGDANITNAWIEYQCPVGQNAVLGTAQNPTELGTLSLDRNVECKPCVRSSRQWWYIRSGSNWQLLSEVDFQSSFRQFGGEGYVASCNSG